MEQKFFATIDTIKASLHLALLKYLRYRVAGYFISMQDHQSNAYFFY